METTVIAIFIIAVCIILFVMQSINYSQKLKDEGVIENFPIARYLGGFDYKEGGQNINFKITNKGLILGFYKPEENITIKYSKISNIRIMSEQSISNDLKVGNIVLFGLAGFAMKDKSVKVQNYLVIDINENNKEFSILIDVKNKEKIVSLVREKINNNLLIESV